MALRLEILSSLEFLSLKVDAPSVSDVVCERQRQCQICLSVFWISSGNPCAYIKLIG